ncbi:MAG: hybrid sensor histidine kinase/response regulator [Anaerolineae bacterium]|nr:hybrid sensor histidine kinase/response regulator [Anaerolineae bacterium]
MSLKTRVLYIEDDPGSQRLVSRVLEPAGFDVFLADEGLAGINLARDVQPDLILMDINLPGLNGREITTRLRGLPYFAGVPIIALTANTSSQHRERALAAGCDGYLTKPIDVATFRSEIKAFLHGRREELAAPDKLVHLERHAQRIVTRLEDKIRQLEEANARLRELDRLKSDFIALVSHELRTPLTLLEGYAHLLDDTLRDAESGDPLPDLHLLVDGLNVGVERIGQVISEIINASRIASGEIELAIRPILLHELVAYIIDDIADVLAQRNLRFRVLELESLPSIEGDPHHLYTAFSNVVGNAIKYTPDGGAITVSARQVGDAVDVSVADTGIGIPQAQAGRVFEQFHVLGEVEHHTTSKSAFKGGGIGLGLTIARGIIEAHRGRIWVGSATGEQPPPQGATFHVLLPLRQPAADNTGNC